MHRKVANRLTLVALIFLALGWAGCTTPHLRLYEEPPRDSAEVAVLKVQWKVFGPSARIQTLDGKPVEKGRLFKKNIKEAELLPGPHTLEVSYFNGSVGSIKNATLMFTCEPAGVYELCVAPVDRGFLGALAVGVGGVGYWTAWIKKANTEEVVAGAARTTPLRWYE